MKKIYILFSALLFAGVMQGQLVTSISINAPFGSNMAGKLGQVEDMLFTAGINPNNAADKTVTWSITAGNDVAEIVDATGGIVKALKGGSFTIKATANDGSGITKEATYTVTDDVPVVSKGLYINFNQDSPTDLYLPEHHNEYILKTDSTKMYSLSPMPAETPDTLTWVPVYKIDMTENSMKFDIDKLGPPQPGKDIPTSETNPLAWPWKTFTYSFSALRVSLSPAYNNTLVDMSTVKKINLRIKSSADFTMGIGWCSYNTSGNPGEVRKLIAEDTATWRVYQFDFTNKSNFATTSVDSSKVSHLFLNFNPGFTDFGKFWKSGDCKAKMEIQYIALGEMALVVPVEKITVSGPGMVAVNRTGKYDFEILPSNASNQDYVIWTTSDPTIATIDGNGNLNPKKEGTVTIIATSADIDAGIPVVSKGEYQVVIGAPAISLNSLSTDFFVTNPVNDRLTIGGAVDLSYVDIISITGKTIKSVQNTSPNHLNIDMTEVPAGVYIVKCYSLKGEVITKKIVKQ